MAAPQLVPDKMLIDVMSMSKGSQTPKDLISKFADFLRSMYGVDQVIVKEAQQTSMGTVDEFTLNTGKPYIDNSLSSYSTFGELIGYYNSGFKCCVVLPIVRDGKSFGTITLLSKNDEVFTQAYSDSLGLISSLVSSEASIKFERDKSLSLAKYFDASFNSLLPQMLVDSKGAIVKANKAALNYFDRSQKELSEENIGEIFDIDQQSMSRLFKGTQIVTYQKESNEKIFELSPSRINENLSHILVNEVSRLRDAEMKTVLMNNADSEVFVILNGEKKISWVSGNIDKIFKVNKDNIIGKGFFDFVIDSAKIKSAIDASNGRYVTHATFNFGNDMEIDAKLLAYKSEDHLLFILAKDYDKYINDLKSDAEQLVELSNDSIVKIDPSGYITSYNKSAEKLFKLSKETIGTQVDSLCADQESLSKLTSSLSIARANGIISDVFVNMADSSKTASIPCQQTIKAIFDEKSEVVGYLMISKELRSKKELEQARDDRDRLAKDVEKLKTESELKSQFIYNISHDLKTPITNIMGFSKLLLTDDFGPLTAEQRDNIQIIYDESGRFMQLVKQILDVAKLSSGIVSMDRQNVKFKDIEENPSIKSLSEASSNKGVEIKWIVDPGVPDIVRTQTGSYRSFRT
jgi:nitrogen-specific signal transduction histidine kinase